MKKTILLIILTLALALSSCWVKESSDTVNLEAENKVDVWFEWLEDWWNWEGGWNDWLRN